MADRIQIRRDTKANWEEVNPILAAGELGFELDNNKLKVGNGVSAWLSLPYITETDWSSVLTQIEELETKIQTLEERVTTLEG